MYYKTVIAATLITCNCVLATSDLTQLLGILAKEIVVRYFMNLQPNNLCVGILTEESSELLDYLLPLDIATVHVNLSHTELIYSKRLGKYIYELNHLFICVQCINVFGSRV